MSAYFAFPALALFCLCHAYPQLVSPPSERAALLSAVDDTFVTGDELHKKQPGQQTRHRYLRIDPDIRRILFLEGVLHPRREDVSSVRPVFAMMPQQNVMLSTHAPAPFLVLISRTPIAAVLQYARKTPFQMLGECSAVKLKGASPATSVFGSPVLARGIGGRRASGPKVNDKTEHREGSIHPGLCACVSLIGAISPSYLPITVLLF